MKRTTREWLGVKMPVHTAVQLDPPPAVSMHVNMGGLMSIAE